MLRMIEVIGISPNGYSEAVRTAMEQLTESGEKVHFFEVLEQRGAVREGKFKEFQVKLKAAVEISGPSPVKKGFCPTCRQAVSEGGHLCVPVQEKDKKCDWCGALIVNERHLCNGKVKELTYICNSCGRTAVRKENLCRPEKIKK